VGLVALTGAPVVVTLAWSMGRKSCRRVCPLCLSVAHCMWLPWRWGLVVALGAVVASLLSLRFGDRLRMGRYQDLAAAALKETGVVMVLYSIWQYAGGISVMGVGRAIERAQWVIDTQERMFLPSEISVQKLFLPSSAAIQFANGYYAIAHVPALVGCLVWAFFAHRSQYSRLRNVVALTTLGCLLIQLIPLAPPRMMPGFVDTGLVYNQSVYSAMGRGLAGQLAAMPSVHVAWAAIVTWFGCTVRGRSWIRVLTTAHGVLTVWAVVVTGNHFWLDGIVAIALIAIAIGILRLKSHLTARLPTRTSGPPV
jgi:hypothetical protein